jgi:hypothetical protein
MSHQATLIYTESLLRTAVFAFWRRSVGIGYVVALAAMTVSLGILFILGKESWLIGALATLLVLGITLPAILYLIHYRNSLRKFREMGNAQATFYANKSSFTMHSNIGTTTLQWSVVRELWQFPDVWLLLYSKAQFSTLPLVCMSAEMQSFIAQRVRSAGGKVCG